MLKRNDPIIIQGITGSAGSFQTKTMLDFGTNVVAGVTPKKKGQRVHNIPVFNTVKETLHLKPKWSVLFVPAPHTKAAALEALKNKLNIVIITEGVPVQDVIDILNYAKKVKRKVIGPNGPGITIPGLTKLGIMPNHLFKEGNVAIISRSGTLTYEVISLLSKANIGQSFCLGIGGDQCIGTSFKGAIKFAQKDKKTKQIIMIGEIGGALEEQAADYIKKHKIKNVIAFISGVSAPKGVAMGHAGAIAKEHQDAQSKITYLKKKGITIANTPNQIVKLVKDNL